MGSGSGYRDLLAWQEAMNFVVMIYRVTSRFPKEETYGLTAQTRKSAVSVPSNIAEGKRSCASSGTLYLRRSTCDVFSETLFRVFKRRA